MVNKLIKLFLSIIILFSLDIVYAQSEILYDEEVGTNSVIDMQSKWISNNDRVFVISTIMDGDSTNIYRYLYYSNLYPDNPTVVNGSDKRALRAGEYLTININNLNINVSQYEDIRLEISYLAYSRPWSLPKNNGLKFRSIFYFDNK